MSDNKYVESVMNYTGSKYKLLEQIVPLFDYTKPNFVDLFCGSFVVGANVLDKYDKIVGNDIISELVGIHKGLLESDDIVRKTKEICPSKDDQEAFLKLREKFNVERKPEQLWALMLCSTNNIMRFNQKMMYNQSFGLRSYNDNTQRKVDEWCPHIRKYKDKIRFISSNFNDVVLSKNAFYYIDPPYAYICDENGDMLNKQISEAGYNAFYKKEDDINLYNYIKKIDEIGTTFCISGTLQHDGKTSWILNKLINDGFKKVIMNFNYNKVSRKGDKETIEVIVKNF